ncbi:MAG: WbqC family protein [Polyangia bacterium]
MRVAIHQPNYVPWCGFFAKLRAADVLVLLDDAQMPRGRSYVSRAQVLGPDGPMWLTVPTHHAADERILDVRIADAGFGRRHLATLRARYGRAPHFAEIFGLLEPIYAAVAAEPPGERRLVTLNLRLLTALAAYLELDRPLVRASALGVPRQQGERGDDRLIALVRAVGGRVYLSGPGGERYQDPAKFAAADLTLELRRYQPVPYDQGRPFVPGLSLLDPLFRLGRGAASLLRYPDGAG